ncbi:unnamed protein product [Spirodela intermedia]|uniref:Malectin-like domain-containing protein n=1 Tax=Spirodela intermedia TaxID=51605 RepID=A0A7I8JBQ2_SPIIN|nr:unnamed protein product [Spirodela intermedia]CAA6667520.1 unnamed protein product [Spirodela intermedia]
MNSPASRYLQCSVFLFFTFFFFLRVEHALVRAQPGFISVDCGLPDESDYRDDATGITYIAAAEGFPRRYRTLRVFPQGGRNCYNLRPVHLGESTWLTIRLSLNDSSLSEVIAAAQGHTIWVCLVNTNKGTPLISTIEVRPLPNLLYPQYPEDPYDRIWLGLARSFPVINTTSPVAATSNDSFQVPSRVLRTAISVPNVSYSLILQNMTRPNQTRIMDLFGEGREEGILRNYTPPFLEADHVRVTDAAVGQTGIYNISLIPSIASTLPPMINAMESFLVRKVDELPTDLGDVRVIQAIRAAYKLKRNWQGDPCVPIDYVWDGNLSSSGLIGEIPRSIANLTALTTLDMSNNNLSGSFPDFLAELPEFGRNKITLPSGGLCTKLMNRRRSLRNVLRSAQFQFTKGKFFSLKQTKVSTSHHHNDITSSAHCHPDVNHFKENKGVHILMST